MPCRKGRAKGQKNLPRNATITNQTIEGVLEIDYNRGIVYFHVSDKEIAERLGLVTALRLSGLELQFPLEQMIDVRAGAGVTQFKDEFVTNPDYKEHVTPQDIDPLGEESE